MYLALYRKYRPKTFADVISQPHITTTLKNQIASGKTAHAYLFTGSRGTGKTTCAKILSMAVNCLSPVDGNPCMQCAACQEIDSGAAVDIVEMDAASNRGVDDVRRLRDEVSYTPVTCKYRVYIIDEVHMLTQEAFNALLKTLEEPPPHVKFILATTELHKVLPTIVSRCQRFEFRRIDIADSAARLMEISNIEGVQLDNDAAELISRLSDGGMRDALSILDRCISTDKHVTSALVRACAGVADNRHLLQFSEMIAKSDISGCIRLLTELHNGSKDIARVIDELSGHYRDLMLFKTVPGDTSLLGALPEDIGELARICDVYSLDDILRNLTLLQQCADGIGKTKQRKTVAEMCLVKMCLGYGAVSAGEAPVRVASTSSVQPVQAAQTSQPAKSEEMRKLDEAILNSDSSKLSAKERKDMERFKAMAAAIAGGNESGSVKSEPAPAVEIKPEPASVVETKPELAPVAETKPEPAPVPEYNARAAAPMQEDIPLPEEPDEEFVPQREFDTAPLVASVSDAVSKVEAPVKTAEEPAAPQKAAEPIAPTEQTQPEEKPVEPIKTITPAQWDEIVAKVPSLYVGWMQQSVSSVNSGVLEIHTTNESFKAIVDNRGTGDIENVLREVFGKHVKALVVLDEVENTAEDKNDAVKQLLDKARQLGIDVKIKN